MQVGKLFIRVIPQSRNRGWMLVAGFDSSVNQTTMVRYVTLQGIHYAYRGLYGVNTLAGATGWVRFDQCEPPLSIE
jgi:hypothetical protein